MQDEYIYRRSISLQKIREHNLYGMKMIGISIIFDKHAHGATKKYVRHATIIGMLLEISRIRSKWYPAVKNYPLEMTSRNKICQEYNWIYLLKTMLWEKMRLVINGANKDGKAIAICDTLFNQRQGAGLLPPLRWFISSNASSPLQILRRGRSNPTPKHPNGCVVQW